MITEENQGIQSSTKYRVPPRNRYRVPPRNRYRVPPPRREYILLRPDTYIGSIDKQEQTVWVWEEDQMVRRSISYVPGLYRIFDEILVNAADNKQRDPKMDSVKVTIDVKENLISVYNNGDGIPVEFLQEEGVYVPEILFGHVMTSSNCDDSIKKTTGGRYGFGAKLTNIFSTEFIIETADGKRKYKQVFSNNMGKRSIPAITDCESGENWTQVSFSPDLSKFGMKCLEADVVALMKRRVVDLAGCFGKSVKVELDGEHVPFTTFEDYVKLYLPSSQELGIYEKVNERWEVCVSMTEGHFEQVSFTNNIATIKGGRHVDYIADQIAKHLVAVLKKQGKHANLKARNVKKYLWLFVNALIDNPDFDSQRKETLTSKQSSFGSKCELTPDFLKKVVNSDIVEKVLSWVQCKPQIHPKKADGNKRGKLNIPELKEANFAATYNSDNCTLILTEGRLASALAMSGLSIVGQDYYGVFPLKGILLNVREPSTKQLQENVEIQNIMKVLGFQHGKEHKNVKSLRYGHLLILADQDCNRSRIKELLIKFLHSCWPSLPDVSEFVLEFITPIAKATDKITNNVLNFIYTIPEYEEWERTLGQKAMEIEIKYYNEGLETSNGEERGEYFADLDKHKRDFVWVDDMNKLFISADYKDGDAIELAFIQKKIEAKKTWLRALQAGMYFDSKEKHIVYHDFINKELIRYSMDDLQSIPSMVDGLKPVQRKILFCAFKKLIFEEVNVFEFSCYVCGQTAYQYADVNRVASTIIGMAQDFVGSNNINLLYPGGQFGSRLMGGKDHGNGSCISTKLTPIARHLFHKADELVLNYLHADNKPIEPTWYLPIIPMVLVNGSEGIGTRWNTFVPNYNPRVIIANVRHLLNDEPMELMEPWYNGFKGTIKKSSNDTTRYISTGKTELRDDGISLGITELPVRRWTEEYRKVLMAASLSGKDEEPFIEDYKAHYGASIIHFEVTMTADQLNKAKEEGLLKKFKLTTNLNTSNMHLRDANGVIKKYETPEQILEDFFRLRLDYYEKRMIALLCELESEISELDCRARVIKELSEGIKERSAKKGTVAKSDFLEYYSLESKKIRTELTLKKNELAELKRNSSKTLNKTRDAEYEATIWKLREKATENGPGSPVVMGKGKGKTSLRDEEEITSLAERMARQNLNTVQEEVGDDVIVGLDIKSSLDQVVLKKKEPANRAAAGANASPNKKVRKKKVRRPFITYERKGELG